MGDNVRLDAGSGGDLIAADDDGTAKHQWVKIEYGANNTFTPVTAAAPLPVGANTAKDGSGTLYAILVDSDGHVQMDVLSIATGDNNIGNVDIVTLPAGNLGMRAMAASLSVTPASDITDGTYIGDIKFGEALPAGTAAIGKLAANSGVDIGDVDVTSMPPNTTATGTVTALAGTVGITTPNGCSAVSLQITGTWVGQLEFEGTVDGTNYASVEASNGAQTVNATAGNDIFLLPGAGYVAIRVRASAWTSGTANITFIATIGSAANILTGAIPAGANAIGKLAANSGVDIGDVDVTSVVPGTGATNLGKARASALGATDTGVAALAVRNDDLADLAGADGDYTPLQVNSEGALYTSSAKAEIKQVSGVAAGGAPGTDNMIAAVAGKKILVLAMGLFATSVTTNTVYVDNEDNDLFGNSGNGLALSLDADGDTVAGFVLPFNPGGWFKTDTVNEAVTLNTSAAEDIIYTLTYIETD